MTSNKKHNRRVRSDDITAVTSQEQLVSSIARIGQLQTEIEAATAEANKSVEDIKAELKTTVSAANDEIKILTKATQIYFTANQNDILPAGRKSVELDSGEIGTRTPPVSVTIKNANAVIEMLEDMDLTDECVTVKKSINKPGLIRNKDKVETIEGVNFSQKEQFFITPKHIPVDHAEQA